MDGAIDQTFAFNRQQFVQLTAAKIEHADKLAAEVPSPEHYVMQAIGECCRCLGQPVNTFFKDKKHADMLGQLQTTTGIVIL